MEMKKRCQRCPTTLDEAATAFICSYECTFCTQCCLTLGGTCPNCGGELLARPRRVRKPSRTQIVPFTESLSNDLVRLFDEYRQFYQQSSDLEKAQKFLEMRHKNNESFIFMALIDGKAIGFVQIYPTFTSVGMARVWVLNDLYVDKSHRRSGVARDLSEFVIKFANDNGVSRVVLETAKDNLKAQALYEKLGFSRDINVYHYTFHLNSLK